MEIKTGRGFHELSIHLTNPMVMVAVGTKERGRIGYDAAVRLLLKEAEENNEEPLMRYGDGEPATYMGVSNEGALFGEETVILVMPTKPKSD
jgi:hypothetical protein